MDVVKTNVGSPKTIVQIISFEECDNKVTGRNGRSGGCLNERGGGEVGVGFGWCWLVREEGRPWLIGDLRCPSKFVISPSFAGLS